VGTELALSHIDVLSSSSHHSHAPAANYGNCDFSRLSTTVVAERLSEDVQSQNDAKRTKHNIHPVAKYKGLVLVPTEMSELLRPSHQHQHQCLIRLKHPLTMSQHFRAWINLSKNANNSGFSTQARGKLAAAVIRAIRESNRSCFPGFYGSRTAAWCESVCEDTD